MPSSDGGAEAFGEREVLVDDGSLEDLPDDAEEIVAGRVPGRRSAEEITVFKSNGLGVQDIAAAAFVYEAFLAANPF